MKDPKRKTTHFRGAWIPLLVAVILYLDSWKTADANLLLAMEEFDPEQPQALDSDFDAQQTIDDMAALEDINGENHMVLVGGDGFMPLTSAAHFEIVEPETQVEEVHLTPTSGYSPTVAGHADPFFGSYADHGTVDLGMVLPLVVLAGAGILAFSGLGGGSSSNNQPPIEPIPIFANNDIVVTYSNQDSVNVTVIPEIALLWNDEALINLIANGNQVTATSGTTGGTSSVVVDTATISDIMTQNPSDVVNALSDVIFSPTLQFNGATGSFTYTATNASGNSADADVQVTTILNEPSSTYSGSLAIINDNETATVVHDLQFDGGFFTNVSVADIEGDNAILLDGVMGMNSLTITSGDGDDLIAVDDIQFTGGGNNAQLLINSGAGNDLLIVGDTNADGNNVNELSGNYGDVRLTPGEGDDIMLIDSARQVIIVIEDNSGNDFIMGFNGPTSSGDDRINLFNLTGGFGSVTITEVNDNTDTLIDFGGGNTLYVHGVVGMDMTDFIFIP